MSEKESDGNGNGLEDQFRRMLRKANISFMMDRSQVEEPKESGVEKAGNPEQALDDLKVIREFDLKPRDIRNYLDRFVIRQDEAKKVLSVAICDHYNHVRGCIEKPEFRKREYAKHNIILLGPSGVGKTYLMRCVARLIGVPLVKADATKFSETGYVGHDVEDLVRDLVKAADGNTELAQYGIVYVDEIDKIASQSSATGKDVSGRGVQINLLKLMEETDVGLFSQTDLIGQMQAVIDMQRGKQPGKRTISTRHILFIVSGSFGKLADQVKQRVRTSPIGFSHQENVEQADAEYLRLAKTRDFIDFGFEPEFIGRLPIRIVCEALTAEDLEQIMLNSEGSILSQYRSDFDGYGINFEISPEAVTSIARRADGEQTGARGLMTVLERVLRNHKFELPSTHIKSFKVNQATIDNPETALTGLLKKKESAGREALKGEIRTFAAEFQKEHGLKLLFGKEAMDAIVGMCIAQKKSISALCAEHFRDLEYGLKLIARNTGQTSFKITKNFACNPGEEISRRIAKSFDTED